MHGENIFWEMIELSKRNHWLWISLVCACVAFIPGFLLPQFLPEEIRLSLNIVEKYSIFSGLFTAGYVLTIMTFLRFLKKEHREKIEHRATVVVLTISLLILATILHPVLSYFLDESLQVKMPLYVESFGRIFPAFLMSLAGLNVFLLGFNAEDVESKRKMEIIRFLILGITLISLISIAVTFTLSRVGQSMPGSDQRAMIFGSNLLIPIATYALGYLAKLIGLRIVKWIGMFLSLIISFLLSVILYTLLKANIFVCPASIAISLVVGFLLTHLE